MKKKNVTKYVGKIGFLKLKTLINIHCATNKNNLIDCLHNKLYCCGYIGTLNNSMKCYRSIFDTVFFDVDIRCRTVILHGTHTRPIQQTGSNKCLEECVSSFQRYNLQFNKIQI